MGHPSRGDYTPKKGIWKVRFLKMGHPGRGDYTSKKESEKSDFWKWVTPAWETTHLKRNSEKSGFWKCVTPAGKTTHLNRDFEKLDFWKGIAPAGETTHIKQGSEKSDFWKWVDQAGETTHLIIRGQVDLYKSIQYTRHQKNPFFADDCEDDVQQHDEERWQEWTKAQGPWHSRDICELAVMGLGPYHQLPVAISSKLQKLQK
jgi:hypothetical protein